MSAPHHHRRNSKPPSNPMAGTSSDARRGTSSRFIGPNVHLKEETISSYNYFHIRVQALEEKIRMLDTTEQVVILFTGSELPHSRHSWCNECNYLDAILSSYMRRAKRLVGYLVRVKVGSRDEWKNQANPYRTDPSIRLRSLPTLMVWNSGKRLSGTPIFEVDQLVALFDENVVINKPINPNTDSALSYRRTNPTKRVVSKPSNRFK